MRRLQLLFISLLISAIQGYSQDGRYSIHIFGGGSVSLIEQDLYSENLPIAYYDIRPRFSGTENIRIYFRLTESINFLLGYGHSRTGAWPSLYIPDTTFKQAYGITQIRDFTYAFDLGINFRVLKINRFNLNTSIAYSLGESNVFRANSTNINFGDTLVYKKLSYEGANEPKYTSYNSLKFSLGTEYKFGKAKTSAITFDIFFNQGFKKLGWEISDERNDDRVYRFTNINRGSYIAFTLGIKKYFAVRPELKP
ncbi:MAG: hypothetical protein K2X86_06370 [Cytophagaceae bacterium]|nr:hypothetical protein [Cytophagaceae bacterium]